MKLKNKKIIGLVTTFSLLTITSTIITACSQNLKNNNFDNKGNKTNKNDDLKHKDKDHSIEDKEIKKEEIKIIQTKEIQSSASSITFLIEFNKINESDLNSLTLKLNDQIINLKKHEITFNNNNVSVTLNNLEADKNYIIQEIKINDSNNLLNNNQTIQLKTQPTMIVDNFEINNISLVDAQTNRLSLEIDFKKNELHNKQNNFLYVTLNDKEYKFSYNNQNSTKFIVEFNHLEEDNVYNIQQITINHKPIDFKHLEHVFKTKPIVKQNLDDFVIESIEQLNQTNTSFDLKIHFNKHQLENQNKKEFKVILNNKEFVFNNYENNSPFLSLNFSNLEFDTKYKISNITLNDVSLSLKNINTVFYTLNKEVVNTSSLSFNNQDHNYQLYNLPQPNPTPQIIDNESTINPQANYRNHTIFNKFYYTNYNVKNIVSDDLIKGEINNEIYFNSIKQSNNYYSITSLNKSHLLGFRATKNSIAFSIKIINQDLTQKYNLVYRTKNQNFVLEPINQNDDVLNFQIDNLDSNQVIELISLQANNLNIDFKDSLIKLKTKNFSSINNNINLSPDFQWTFENQEAKLQIKTFQNTNQSLYLSYLDHNNTIQYEMFKDLNLNNKFVSLPYKNIKYIFNISYLNNNEYIDIDHKFIVTKPPKHNNEINITNVNFDIFKRKITITNKNQLNNDYQNVRVLVKNQDVYNKWSNFYNAKIVDNKIVFKAFDLPSNISDFVISEISFDEEITYLSYDQKHFFNKPINLNKIVLENLNFYKDESSKTLFGSLGFNFSINQTKLFKEKWFELIFEAETPKSQNNDFIKYENLYHKTNKIYVRFEDLWKFKISGLLENIRYTLVKINVVNAYNQTLYFSNVGLKDDYNRSFVYNFDYNEFQHARIDNNQEIDTTNSQINLASKQLNLTKHDLVSLNKNQPRSKNIPFSLQNFYALIEYERDKNSALPDYSDPNFFDNQSNFKLYKNNQIVNKSSFAGREFIKDNLFTINQTKTKAILSKDLNVFKNLEQIANDQEVIFYFKFEFEIHKKVLNELESMPHLTKTTINIPISYQQIKSNKTINNAIFSISHYFENAYFNEQLKQKINYFYNFNISLENNQLNLIIESKNQNAEINNKVYEHNMSTNQSVFVGLNTFFVYWTGNNKNLGFKNNKIDELSIGLSESKYIDSEQMPTFNLNQPNESAKRLFKEDQSVGINTARARSFSFSDIDGTWNLLGKVDENNPYDHRYFITTNNHVWINAVIKNSKNTLSNNDIGYVRNINFKIPNLDFSKQEYLNNINHPVVSQEAWNLNPNLFPLELITSFDDDKVYPNRNDFKDNNGGLIANSKEARSDFIVAIIDLSFFFNNFEYQDLDQEFIFNNKTLTKHQKNVINFFLNWKNLKAIKPSKETKHFNHGVNFNWYTASLPKEPNQAPDGSRVRRTRYREHLLANTLYDIDRTNYGGSTSGSMTVSFDIRYFDSSGGGSGTAVYDHLGDLVGFVVQASTDVPPNSNSLGYASFLIIDDQRVNFLSSNIPANPGSFYEYMKKLSYLYPTLYSSKNFQK